MPILIWLRDVLSGVSGEEEFQMELLMYINTAIAVLVEMGVTQFNNVYVDDETVMPDFGTDATLESLVKVYLGLKVKTLFDPPNNATVAAALSRNLAEAEFRLQILINQTEAQA